MTDTKTRVMDSAERLFAERGFAATSLRDITADAGVNLAAVNYHFGTKEALLSAVFERRFGPINQERLELLDAAESRAEGAALDLEEILRFFLLPPFAKMQEWGDAGPNFIRLVGRAHSDTNEQTRASFLRPFEGIVSRYEVALRRALPNLDRAELRWRLHFVIGAMAHTMAWCQMMKTPGRKRGVPPEIMQEALVRFVSAGMRAPASDSGGETS